MHDLPSIANEQTLYDNTDNIEHNPNTSKIVDQNIDHTEEVIIGTEHGTTFPT